MCTDLIAVDDGGLLRSLSQGLQKVPLLNSPMNGEATVHGDGDEQRVLSSTRMELEFRRSSNLEFPADARQRVFTILMECASARGAQNEWEK